MQYKVKKEKRTEDVSANKVVWTVYERPCSCLEWKEDLSFVNEKAAKDRVKYLKKNFNVTVKWEAEYNFKSETCKRE